MERIINDVRLDLQHHSDEKRKKSAQHFFRETILAYGVPNAEVARIGKKHFASVKDNSKQEIFDYCNEFWQSGFLEESLIACQWSYAVKKRHEASDFAVFENWVNLYVNNWASCDTFCNHNVGELVERFPELMTELKKWAASPNRWMRRGAAVSLIVPARKGLFLSDIFQIANLLLTDKDDMVQKGYGWMLKAASQAHLNEVFDFVIALKNTMPRTAYRYAIEKMPADMRKKAMEKH